MGRKKIYSIDREDKTMKVLQKDKIRKMLMSRPLDQIPKTGSKLYQAFWDGYNGNKRHKYLADSLAGLAYQVGKHRGLYPFKD